MGFERFRPVIEPTDRPKAPPVRCVAIYVSNADSPLAANQRAAMQRYADAMGWTTVTVIIDDKHRLLDGAATHAFDLVLCWRTGGLRHAESLIEGLSAHSVELLAMAQSCAALME
jgi:hypothetical protein